MKKYLIAVAMVSLISAPTLADEVGVHVGPKAEPGVTVGEGHERDRTVVKEHEPSEKTVIKKEDEYGNREKKVIEHDHDHDHE